MRKAVRKTLSILLAAVLLSGLISCGRKEEGDVSEGTGQEKTEASPEKKEKTEAPSKETETSESSEETETAVPDTEPAAPYVLEVPDPVIPEPNLVTDSLSYCVLDDDGTVWLSKNPTEHLKPASMTKVMTALIVVENVPNLDVKVTISEEAVLNIDVLSSGVSPAFRPGETVTVRDLLYALILPSTNTAGNILAEYVSGSTPAFCELMNAKCRELGLQNSHFSNAHGLDKEDHYSCAFDQAVILREAMKYPVLPEIFGAKEYVIPATEYCPERIVKAGHKMISGEYAGSVGVIGGKPGWTAEAQGTLATVYEREGKRMYVVTMHSDEYLHYVDTANLADYAYAKYTGVLTNLRTEILDFHVSASSWEGITLSWKAVNRPQSVRLVYWNADIGTSAAVFINDVPPEEEMSYCFPLTDYGPYYVQVFATGVDGEETYQSRMVLFMGQELPIPGSINSFYGCDYYINERGLLENFFVEIPGHCYYAGQDGRLRKGCFVDDYHYYADENFEIISGWKDLGSYRYYFQSDGEKVTGRYLLGGTVYSFDENGALEQ